MSCFAGWKSAALTKDVHSVVVTATDSRGLSVSLTGWFIIKSGKVR